VQNNNLTTADMGFRSDCGYYSQDDGTMAIGFAVTGLYGTGRLWGAGSPYSKYPDPGFNLPFRWDYQIQKNPLDHLVENSDPQKRYQLRGIKFEKNIGGQTSTTGSLQNGLGLRLLEKGTDYKITLRVINYSFVSANNVTVKYYYQPWDENNPDPAANYPVDNPASSSKCRFLVDNKITSIAGRKSNTDNWALSNIIWTVPKEPGLGYLHTVIDFAGQTELNAANNHGYTLVGMYDPKIFENVTNQIQSASASSLSVIDPEKRPDLQLISVSATELKEDGTLGEEVTLNNNARYKKLKITVKAKFTGGLINIGGNEKSVQYMPIVGIGLFTGKKYQTSLLAAEEYPVLTEGNEKELSFVYDPKNPGYDVKNGVSVKIFSPLLGVKEQKNLEDNVKVLWNTQDASSGGSGGCATTAFPLVLLALLPLAFRKKK
ncbi:MAG: Synerg-CTERM sorting domain-containing protein, partial [Cloacibacillus sp.]